MVGPESPALPAEATGLHAYEVTATTSLPERRLRILKHGHTFGLFDPHGDVVPGRGSPEGVFHDDTRFLSCLRLHFNGLSPLLLSSTVQDNNALLSVDLTNPDIFDGERLLLAKDVIHLLRTKFIWQGRCFERLRIQNYGAETHSFTLTYNFAADFADLFEVRGHQRTKRGKVTATVEGSGTVAFRYRALDGWQHALALHFDPAPTRLLAAAAHYELTLRPGEQKLLFVAAHCENSGHVSGGDEAGFLPSFRQARRAHRLSISRGPAVETSNEIFNEMLRRSKADLYMLLTDTEDGPYPYAGVPWYSTVFGRDGIITAIEMLWVDPGVARGVLCHLATLQAIAVDAPSDAEPGKILHEMRLGEMARLGEVPFRRYYGSVDATPLFILLAGLYHERTQDLETIRKLWPHIEAALAWIDHYGDLDGDGLIEYARKDAAGLLNQGWKDSHDAVFHEDGSRAAPPIALCEVQGYVFAAKRQAARLAHLMGRSASAVQLEEQAERLRGAVEDRFWMPDRGFYALALDGDKRPCRVLTSNAGHLLFCGLPSPERARRVVEALSGTAFFSGWGLRTVATGEARYNPISYHNGSVWPHDNALIALGFSRYGFSAGVHLIFQGLFDTAAHMDSRRLPELFCGFRRQRGSGPTTYPVACAPQAWASAAPFALLQACLGLTFDAANRAVRFRRPRLPRFLDEMVIRQLSLHDARADILLRRYGDDVSVNVLNRSGDLSVAVTY
jgi:glycogen debranching enzyme